LAHRGLVEVDVPLQQRDEVVARNLERPAAVVRAEHIEHVVRARDRRLVLVVDLDRTGEAGRAEERVARKNEKNRSKSTIPSPGGTNSARQGQSPGPAAGFLCHATTSFTD